VNPTNTISVAPVSPNTPKTKYSICVGSEFCLDRILYCSSFLFRQMSYATSLARGANANNISIQSYSI
jgi:hypothetical protein